VEEFKYHTIDKRWSNRRFVKKHLIKNISNIILIILSFSVLVSFTECSGDSGDNKLDFSIIQSYREIPGVTASEISAIEALQKNRGSIVYGITPSTEAFAYENGDVKGYASLFCEWLTRLFGIKFELQIHEWIELTEKLNSGEVDFSIHFLSSDENLDKFYISDPIAERQFIITHLEGSPDISRISRERKPRYAFTVSSPTESTIASVIGRGTYDAVWAEHYDDIYGILERGEADAVITTKAAESNFIKHDDLIQEDFFPLTFSPVSMISANPQME